MRGLPMRMTQTPRLPAKGGLRTGLRLKRPFHELWFCLTMVAMPLRDVGELVNRIDHRALEAITDRLEVIAGQLDVVAQRKARKPKVDAPAEPVARAA